MARIVGIDLGTTNSAVAYMKNGRPAIVPTLQGSGLTPSVVAFANDDRRWVGQLAKTAGDTDFPDTESSDERSDPGKWPSRSDATTVVSSIKRQMGQDRVVEASGRAFSPVEISTMILEKLKSDAETYLGESIDRAVITVPAYFDDNQRRATRSAAAMAGLEVVRLVNEPTAAALAYGLDLERAHTILVWDLGGGTFDVSLLELGDGVFEVKAVSGNTHLGGDDYDERLAGMLAERFRAEWRFDLSAEPAHKRLMLRLAEDAKIRLSTETETRVVLPRSLSQGSRCAVTITRDAFVQATADITERMAAPAHQVLADAGYDPLDLDRVILVGGMTRIPAVRRLVKQITGLAPYGHIDPDRVVALGAAVQAGVLAGEVRNVTLVDVTPLSLGIETQGGLFTRLIKRNTSIPATAGRLFTNAQDYQTEMEIHVLQGERELAGENITLGNFQLTGMTAQPRGQAKVEVTFDIDANGMVQVSATDLQAETSCRIRIEAADRPSREDADRILTESGKYVESDSLKRQEIEARIRAENLIRAARQLIEETGQGPHEGLRQAIQVVEEGTSKVQSALADERIEEIEESTKALEASLKALSLETKTNAATVGLQGQAA